MPRRLPLYTKPLAVPLAAKTRKQHQEIQNALPISFQEDGASLATLAQYRDPSVATLSLAELTEEQWREIVAARLEAQESIELVTATDQTLGPAEAAREVREQTAVGRTMLEIERGLIRTLVSPSPVASKGPKSTTPAKRSSKSRRGSRRSRRKAT